MAGVMITMLIQFVKRLLALKHNTLDSQALSTAYESVPLKV